MNHFNNPRFKLIEYRTLQTASLLYIAVPTIIFIQGWIKPAYSMPLTLLILYGLYLSIKAGWDFMKVTPSNSIPVTPVEHLQGQKKIIPKEKVIKKTLPKKNTNQSNEGFLKNLERPEIFYGVTFLIVVVAVLYTGVGGFSIQDGDYIKHNGFFLDLTKYTWPLAYEKTGTDDLPRYLNTYLAYYLPSALLGKVFGFSFGYFFSYVWVCIGLMITLTWLSLFLNRRSVLIIILFMVFGELAYFGWKSYFPNFSMYGKSYNYANWMLFYSMQDKALQGIFWILGSNHTFISNGPHHIFPSWICIMMIFHDSVIRKSTDRLAFIFSFVPFVSAFMAIGLAPFMLLSFIQNKFKNAFTIQNYFVAPLLIVVAGFFLASNNAQFEKGWIWDFINMSDAMSMLIKFFLLSFGLYFIIMPKKARNFPDKKMQAWLFTSVGCIILFSFYRIGKYMDFPIKAYNPSWIIFQVCLLTSISYSLTFVEKIRSAFVILLILIASTSTFSNISYASKNKLFSHPITESNSTHVNLIGPKDQSLALFSDGNSFFWRVLAKKATFTKD